MLHRKIKDDNNDNDDNDDTDDNDDNDDNDDDDDDNDYSVKGSQTSLVKMFCERLKSPFTELVNR